MKAPGSLGLTLGWGPNTICTCVGKLENGQGVGENATWSSLTWKFNAL